MLHTCLDLWLLRSPVGPYPECKTLIFTVSRTAAARCVQVLAVLRGIAEEVVGGAVPDAEPLMAVSKQSLRHLAVAMHCAHARHCCHCKGIGSGTSPANY